MLTPLVGRDEELVLLAARLAEVRGGTGQAVLISGEAGIGKSRLLQAFRECTPEGATWLECRGARETRESVLQPLIALQRQLFGLAPGESRDALERLAAGVAAAGLEPASSVPILATLHGLALRAPYAAPGLGPELLRSRTLELLVDWVLGLARRHALVLTVEDLQWLDPSTLAYLDRVVERLPATPLLLLATFRPALPPPWPASAHVMPLELSRLTRSQVLELVRSLPGTGALPAAWLEEVVTRADGVPLFAEELARAAIARADARPGATRIPPTLRASLMERLDCSPPARQVAECAAVLGREFSHRLLVAVAGLDEVTLGQGLSQLVASDVLVRRGSPPEAAYAFRHVLLQEAVAEGLPPERLRELHLRAVHALRELQPECGAAAPEVLAWHLELAGRSAEAVEVYQEAGLRYQGRSAHREAERNLARALALLVTLPESRERDERELRLRAARIQSLVPRLGHGSSEVKRICERIADLCDRLGDTAVRPYVSFLVGLVHATRAELEPAAKVADALCEGAAGVPGVRMSGELLRALVAYGRGRFPDALHHFEAAGAGIGLARARELGHNEHLLAIHARYWAGRTHWVLGAPERAAALAREAVAEARAHGFLHTLSNALLDAALTLALCGDEEGAKAFASEAHALSEYQGYPLCLAYARVLLGWLRRGSERAVEDLNKGLAAVEEAESWIAMPLFRALSAEVHTAAGDLARAAEELAAGLELSRRTGQPCWDAELLRAQAEFVLRRARGDPEALLRQALEIAGGQGARALELRAATSLARLWQTRGRVTEARSLLAPLYRSFSQGLEGPDLRRARRVLDALA